MFSWKWEGNRTHYKFFSHCDLSFSANSRVGYAFALKIMSKSRNITTQTRERQGQKMPRLSTKYLKIITHIFYLLMFSYLVSQRSQKIIKIKRIDRFIVDMKHILLWTKLHDFKDGQKQFIEHNCEFINCYLTVNRSLFNDIRYFDAIVFNAQEVSKGASDMPNVRSLNQKYIFAANNSADNYPVCDPRYDDFFNWSWSYRYICTLLCLFVNYYLAKVWHLIVK